MPKWTRLIRRKTVPAKSFSVNRAWKRLETWCKHRLPEVLKTLKPAATSRQIEAVEKAIGGPLPKDVRESYQIHDGQEHWPDLALIPCVDLLSLEACLEKWRWWKKDKESTEPGKAVPYDGKSFPEGAICLEYENTGWIPIGADAGGNHLGIDLAPGPNGTLGQVINFGRDERIKCVLALSWGQFLADYADELEQGNFLIEEENGKKSLSLRYPRPGHFFNNCMPWSRAKLGMARLTGNDAKLWKYLDWGT